MTESNAARSTPLRVVDIAGKGRGFIATEPLKGGQIALRESPILVFSAYPLKRNENKEDTSSKYCAHCYRNLSVTDAAKEKTTFTCPVCCHPDDATFCTSKCLYLALKSSHSPWACQALHNLRNCSTLLNDQPEERQVQSRYLIAAYNLGMTNPSAYQTLMSLHGDGERYLDTAAYLHSLIIPPALSEKFPDFSVETTAALLDKETCNSFNLMEPVVENRERGIRAYGIYSNVSLFNHSCLPNACRFEYIDRADEGNTDIIIRMMHDVPEGHEICLSYVRVNRDYSDRKNRLLDYFGFACFCDRCKVEGTVSCDDANVVNLLSRITCNKDNCGGALAPLVPAEGYSDDLLECNYCGEIKNRKM